MTSALNIVLIIKIYANLQPVFFHRPKNLVTERNVRIRIQHMEKGGFRIDNLANIEHTDQLSYKK